MKPIRHKNKKGPTGPFFGMTDKDENCDYFYNIGLICEVIEKKVKIEFFTGCYGADKKLHCRRENKLCVNPYRLSLKNGRYYLACNYDKYDNLIY